MPKLNQILAVEKGIKADGYSAMSEYHKINQKPDLFAGMKKEYQSNDADGDKLPAESKKVQFIASDVLKQVRRQHTSMLNIIARKDWTNTQAKADVVVEGNVIIKDAPPTYLLFLEKQLSDLADLVGKMPVLDSGDDWTFDENTGLYRAPEVKTHRTKKVQRPIVLYDATDKHPAQTQLINEDIIEGYWTTTKFSGAMQRPSKMAMLERIEQLRQAVKTAREQANMQDEVPSPDIGAALYDFIIPKDSQEA